MNKIITLLFILPCFATELPKPDSSKPLYQKRWGGTVIAWPAGNVDQVAWPTPEDPAELKKHLKNEGMKSDHKRDQELKDIDLKEVQRGSDMMFLGVIIAAIGVACHLITAYPIVQKLAYPITVIGFALTGAGMYFKKISQYQDWICLAMSATVLGLVMWFGRKWSVTHLFKEFKFKKKGTSK